MTSCATGSLDGLIIDLDGVVWVGSQPIPGSAEAISELRSRGVRTLFLTNDPQASSQYYAKRLTAMGVPTPASDIVTAGTALATLVVEREGPGTNVFVIGSPSLKRTMATAGLMLRAGKEGSHAQAVVVGGHEGFDYAELRTATQALRRGGRLYAAGRDSTFPMPDGPWPGTGSVVAAVEVAGGARAICAGKPEPYIFDIARALLHGCRRIGIVGDNLESDIAGGRRAGLATVLVLTGATTPQQARSAQLAADITVRDLADLTAILGETSS